jgi:uncharacterized protein YdeI (YjbR/CyaY-like superfamily)
MFTSNCLSTIKSNINIAKVKHNPDAPALIDEAISQMKPFTKVICKKLRKLILSTDPAMIEDWKWGPNYYLNGMVCGFWGFEKHVTFNFYQGALLKDPYKILKQNEGNVRNRHIKFTDVKEIKEDVISEYLFEAIDNNRKGNIIKESKDKTVVIPDDVKKAFKTAKLLPYFESLAYSHRKEYMMWINDAKKEETRLKRINQAIEKLASKEMMHDKYKKKIVK